MKPTLQEFLPPRLGDVDAVPQEVVPLPETRVVDALGHQPLHGGPQLGVLLEVPGDVLGAAFNVELGTPRVPVPSGRVLGEGLGRCVDDMQLRVEAARVDHPPACRVPALKEDLGRARPVRPGGAACAAGPARGRGDGDGVLEEVADVGPEPQERLVGGVLGLLDVAEPLGGLAAQPGEDGLGLGEGLVCGHGPPGDVFLVVAALGRRRGRAVVGRLGECGGGCGG